MIEKSWQSAVRSLQFAVRSLQFAVRSQPSAVGMIFVLIRIDPCNPRSINGTRINADAADLHGFLNKKDTAYINQRALH
jgi:hypothetical protein